MNLRKDQRHTVYIIMRAELEKEKFPDIVNVKNNLINDGVSSYEWIWTDSFPELDVRLDRFYAISFPSMKKEEIRAEALSILDNCIELTY